MPLLLSDSYRVFHSMEASNLFENMISNVYILKQYWKGYSSGWEGYFKNTKDQSKNDKGLEQAYLQRRNTKGQLADGKMLDIIFPYSYHLDQQTEHYQPLGNPLT